MEIILLERIKNLGNIGDLVNVKDGYARNFLLKKEKALRATEGNKKTFKEQKEEIEKANLKKKEEATSNSKIVNDKTIVVIRQAADDGRLYGSVTNKDVSKTVLELFKIDLAFEKVIFHEKIKNTGIYKISLELHAEVFATINIVVSRSKDEAKIAIEKQKKLETAKKSGKQEKLEKSEKPQDSVIPNPETK
ncbi:MAG: large subunit ribosomal protein L9 [Candidatus Midichloriaceae bacterium]|jgi:large subunit ribosomal protein L9